ncbi:MAG: hypothetical protein ACOYMN_07080 [Roseimicrobium sp.]
MKPAFFVTILASLAVIGNASAAWLRLPSAQSAPINLANRSVLGTTITSSGNISNAEALIAGDPVAEARLSAGSSELVFTLTAQMLIDAASFVNDGASGKVVISSSADSKAWTQLAQAVFEESDRYVPVKFAGAQAKYVRLSFEVAKGSPIRSLNLSGANKLTDYKAFVVPEGTKKAVEVDATTLARSSRPIYMFPTPTNVGDADGARTSFKFPKTNERFRTVVYDLGSVRTIKKFNAAYSRTPTRLQVFAFEQLPEKQDWRGKMTLDPAIFDANKPSAAGEDARGEGHIQVTPEKPVAAQYVALRFEPNYHKRAVAGLDPDWEGMAVASFVPFGGLLREFGMVEFDLGTFAQQSQGQTEVGGESFEMYDVNVGGSVQTVLVSRAAIASVQAQLAAQNPGTEVSEAQAVGTILAAAGLTPAAAGEGAGAAGTGTTTGTSETADPGSTSSTPAALSALGLGYGSLPPATSGGTDAAAAAAATGAVPVDAPAAPAPLIITVAPPTSP